MAQTYDVKLFQRGGVTMVRYPDGDEAALADVMRYMNPGMEYDQATGEQMATPPPPAESATYSGSTVRDKPFGSIAGSMAEPYMSQAYDALTRTPVVDPNSYVPQSVQRINQAVGNVGGAGLSGLLGMIYGGAGLVGDVANATGLGGGQRLANDLAGMVEVAGVGPEARMVEMLSNAGAGRSIARTVAERANQRGPVPTMGSNFANLLGDVGEASTGIRAYQGSPHNFAAERLVRMPDGSTQYIVGAPDVLPNVPTGAEVLQDFPLGRMRMDKLGTGEGAQAYGSGLYAAEAEGVAKTYRDTLSQNNRFTPYVTYKAEELLKDAGGDYAKAAGTARQLLTGNLDRQQAKELAEVVKLLDDNRVSTGSMYEVSINADPNAMLDWDKPLGQQSEAIRSAFASLGTPERLASVKGENAYRALQDQSGAMDWPVGASLAERNAVRQTASENARQKMLDAGILGIKYLDEGSRGTGAGTRNFVVFDENLISIVRKYGIAGAAAMLGVSALDVEQAMAQGQPQQGILSMGSK